MGERFKLVTHYTWSAKSNETKLTPLLSIIMHQYTSQLTTLVYSMIVFSSFSLHVQSGPTCRPETQNNRAVLLLNHAEHVIT